MESSTADVCVGGRDLERAVAELASRIPEALAPLAELAYNYRWSWMTGGEDVFRDVDPERFAICGGNPVRLLQETSVARLARAAADADLVSRAEDVLSRVRADLERPSATGPVSPQHPAAFLCAEYGIHQSLPIYSGGLGALAGDLVKEASDQALPFVAVGLMYRKGYFRQRIDGSGQQHEYWIDTDPDRLPAALITGEDGEPLTIRVPIHDADVTARIWRADIGRVPLILLDTDTPENGPIERWITARLYVADADTRLAQYVLLGVGGIRALRAIGVEPGVIHLNEGHAALAPVELAAPELSDGDGSGSGSGSLADAVAGARDRTVFTTHTPVPAGNDSYPASQVEAAIGRYCAQLGLSVSQVIALGRTRPSRRSEEFGITQAALRLSRAANGVSRRHGEVAREMWRRLWPRRSAKSVPIGHVTNGVHIPTWIGQPMRELLDEHLGEGWFDRAADPSTWTAIDEISDEELWGVRQRQRAELTEFVRARSTADRLGRGDVKDYVEAAARAFDPHTLTIGFARRVATYKRLDLLTRDPKWTLSLLGGKQPVQVVLGGKAHPRDEAGKTALRQLFGLKAEAEAIVGARVVFLDDYDLASAAHLVRGCDVWLNVPRPPLEASGTSGMKSVMNGGLQLSVLDGWWAEACDDTNGWGLSGEVDDDHEAQDERDAAQLHDVLDNEVLPAFYKRDSRGIPTRWLTLMRSSLRSLGPQFSASRMLAEYVAGPYHGG